MQKDAGWLDRALRGPVRRWSWNTNTRKTRRCLCFWIIATLVTPAAGRRPASPQR